MHPLLEELANPAILEAGEGTLVAGTRASAGGKWGDYTGDEVYKEDVEDWFVVTWEEVLL